MASWVLAAARAAAYVLTMFLPRILPLWIVLGLILSMLGPAQAQMAPQTFERGHLVIETSARDRHSFDVEVALTPRQQAQGLMYRRGLAADAGMLFVYPRDRPISMWMKNTLIPLDMLFLARDGLVLRIAERAVPLSLQTISSGQAAAAVLELNGGTADRLGIAVGDRVIHPALGGAD